MKTKPLIIFLLATLVFTISASAATISVSSTAPTVDGEDISSALGAGTQGEKLWTDTRAIGQTFTTGSNGVRLNAITLQIQTGKSAQPTKQYTLVIGSVSGTSYTANLATESATQSTAWASDDYITFNLDSPIILAASSVYGFDLAMDSTTTGWSTGIPYMARTVDTVYANGKGIKSTVNKQSTSPFVFTNRDLVFHLDLELPCTDTDSDGYGVFPNNGTANGCTFDGDDCNDSNDTINPGAEEECRDDVDNDCNGEIDEEFGGGCYRLWPDYDDDGTKLNGSDWRCICEATYPLTLGYIGPMQPPLDDCNDSDDQMYPGNFEFCSGKDNDCDGEIDEEGAIGCTTYYADVDGTHMEMPMIRLVYVLW